MIKKIYQVFVSSTYVDLIDERKEVMQSLLELGCLPAGMELFPASNEAQFELIKRVIRESDFYILIVGNRYGSETLSGISYTEMEYDYAKSIGTPILSFLHERPTDISVAKSELDKEKIEKLNLFRKKVSDQLVKFYSSPSDLGGKVMKSLVNLWNRIHRPGWIRGDVAIKELGNSKIGELEIENMKLREQLSIAKNSAPSGSVNLASGEETISIFLGHDHGEYVDVTWNELFGLIGPKMINEASEREIFTVLANELPHLHTDEDTKIEILNDRYRKMDDIGKNSVITQFKALGYIEISDRKRTGKIIDKYWKLTGYGENYLMNLCAIKSKISQKNSASIPTSPA